MIRIPAIRPAPCRPAPIRPAPCLTAAGALALVLATAPGALAQEICGRSSAEVSWAGGGPLTSDISSSGGAFDRTTTIQPGATDVLAFVVSSRTDLRLEAVPEGDGDPAIVLLTQAGDYVGENDDSPTSLASLLETSVESGGYCLEVRGLGSAPMSASIRIGRQDHAALGAGGVAGGDGGGGGGESDGSACAPGPMTMDLPPLSAAAVAGGAITSVAPVDQTTGYALTLTEPLALSIQASNETADPTIRLTDAAGSVVAENDDANGLNSLIEMASPLAPGSYCLTVGALSDSSAPITVSVDAFDPAEAMQRRYANGELSPPLDGSYPVEPLGTLKTRLSRDMTLGSETLWHSFELAQAGLVVADAIGIETDPEMMLFDAAGRPMARNDDGAQGTDARFAVPLQAGTYAIGVKLVSSGSTGTVRLSLERYVPAQ